MFYLHHEEISVTYSPLPSDWSEESRNNSPTASLDAHRSAVGIFLFTGNTQYDASSVICRHASRTRHHTQADFADMRHLTAYLHTTREIGFTFHPRGPLETPTLQLQFASDYGHGVFSYGFCTIGNMAVGGSLRGNNGALTALAVKDSGIPASTTPDGKVKAYVSQIKVALDLINLANDT